ncbi:ArnT family glycosyltransferase [Nocardia caishijiensis]|uniref:Dolichyl-phosphate-mannose-protein mannosyltransferase n=1 Tax=Nocardia caishijiensis TaxID=184756 RepID=A0ABQ6YPK7_9NOCA|nr:glycosyltransferase family 39 protein [Nocardia caishijiensis]KAF0847490.1 dolichyl-phosphate-mannose-protein mannosyltransferase [Nocardia caishijiensis]
MSLRGVESPTAPDTALPALAWREVSVVAAVAGVLFLTRLDRYRVGGDELYFLAAGRHPSVSYADQGPLVPLLAALSDQLAAGSVVALRLPALLCTVAAVVLSAVMVREFGGGRLPQTVAALAYATTPMAVMQSAMLSTFALDITLTAVIAWLWIRWVRTRADGLLLAAGAVAALDFQVKWLIPIIWAVLAFGVAVFGPRAMLRRPAWWLGSALLVGSAVPILWWQHRNGWPQLAMGAIVRAEQLATAGVLAAPWTMIQVTGVGGLLLLVGMWAGLRSPRFRPYRFLIPMIAIGLSAVVLAGLRPYFVAGAFPGLFAAGAVYLTDRGLSRRGLVFGGAVAGLATTICVALVLALPRPESALRTATEDYAQIHSRSVLFGPSGWEDLVDSVTWAHAQLTARQRAGLVIVTQNYWQAAALEEYGPAAGLPTVYSPNRGYGYFGAPPDSATTVLYVGVDGPETGLRTRFASTTLLSHVDETLGFPGVNRGVAVWLCTGPSRPWSALWPDARELRLVDGTTRHAR